MPDPTTRSPASRSVELIPGGPVSGEIRPPGSKSVTNRALLCAAFAQGRSCLTGALRSEDTEVMVDALRAVGVEIETESDGRTLKIVGRGRAPRPVDAAAGPHGSASHPTAALPTSLFIGNSGTTIRFLTAALSAAGGDFRLHGVPRMHERPIGDLIDALTSVTRGSIHAESAGGCPPVRIESDGWQGDEIAVRGNVSSQYLSGLMMAAPISGRAIRIRVEGELVSKPYVEMTAAVMKSFGARVEPDSDEAAGESFRIAADGYQGQDYAIEPDASAASYFWAAAAITGGTVTVRGLGPSERANAPLDLATLQGEPATLQGEPATLPGDPETLQGDVGTLQGDVAFTDVLAQMGCQVSAARGGPGREPNVTVTGGRLRGVDVDMNAISDTVQTLAVVALFADGPTRVRGVAHNRFKETDRIADLARELRRLGATVDEHEDGMTITPPARPPETGIELETYGDHRMAMSLALAGLRVSGVRVLDPACTAKTYPEFFADLESLIGRSHRWAATSV